MINILQLEDNADDSELICKTLRHAAIACHVTRVDTREAFSEALDQSEWDIILADYSLPSFDGISALKLAVEKSPSSPFIFVTGSLGEERAVETLKNGATDFILKNRLDRLPRAVKRARRESVAVKAQKETEQKLKASLREKELLLQEVHHRVKNNLQIICSLLNMQSRAVNNPLLASALQESERRIRSMAMIHEMLYDSSSLNDIDFSSYAHSLAAAVYTSYGLDPARIALTLELEPLSLEIDRAIPCGLILNELISNALKHAFPDNRGGEIHVSLRRQERCVHLAVEDTGVGLPEGHSSNEFKSIGLSIINVLTQQLGGSMNITSNRGAHFVLSFAQ